MASQDAAQPAAQAGVVTFDYTAWAAHYPALATSVDATRAQACFDEATLYLSNTPGSPVRDTTRRALLLGMLVAHLALLDLPESQGGAGGMVGRLRAATRGSVSVTTEFGTLAERAAWFSQTQPGASFWAATRGLRRARYVPGLPQRPLMWP